MLTRKNKQKIYRDLYRERKLPLPIYVIGNSAGIPYCIKSPAGQDPEAAERQMSLEAIRRRRRILPGRILFRIKKENLAYKNRVCYNRDT